MAEPARDLGRRGEAVAEKYYRQRGCLLLARNYRTRMGELDLVLYHEGTVIFAEVKTRAGRQKGAPAEAVDARKQQRLILAAQQFLASGPYADCPARFDVVEVLPVPGPAGRTVWQVHCIPNAFEA